VPRRINQLGFPWYRCPVQGERTAAIHELLSRQRAGDRGAVDELFRLLYDDLRGLARGLVRGERGQPTAGPTALVHEAYLRLRDGPSQAADEREFTGLVAQCLRHLLIDAGRRRRRVAGPELESLAQGEEPVGEELSWLEVALERLEALDPELYQVVQFRFLAGRSVEDTARLLGLSEPTVKRRWQVARAWLRQQRSTTR
jgi:RNA polymerase sigma-70 factor (ECF subfamily)